jgi:hypothetical protein
VYIHFLIYSAVTYFIAPAGRQFCVSTTSSGGLASYSTGFSGRHEPTCVKMSGMSLPTCRPAATCHSCHARPHSCPGLVAPAL